MSDIEKYLEAIGEDKALFIHAIKDGYQVLNYILPCNKTFPNVKEQGISDEERFRRTLRLDLRGIIFDIDGNIISMPHKKFFNLNEKFDTLSENIDFSKSHYIMDKADGSMVRPFEANGRLIWGTKMGENSDFSPKLDAFVEKNSKYILFAKTMINMNYTAIFEYVSPENQIVIQYDKEDLILTGIRKNKSGEYLSYEQMKEYANWFEIPVIKVYKSEKLTDNFIQTLRSKEGIEGVVVAFEDGERVKVKVDWYVNLHRVKSAISDEKSVVKLILENGSDDIKPLLDEKSRIKLENFENELSGIFEKQSEVLHSEMYKASKMSRKDYALSDGRGWVKTLVFKCWDYLDNLNSWEIAEEETKKFIVNNCVNNKKYANMKSKDSILENLSKWTGGMFNE